MNKHQDNEIEQYVHLTMTHPVNYVLFWIFIASMLLILKAAFVDVPNYLDGLAKEYVSAVEAENTDSVE